jgi:carnitine 3-dehydrogenase
MRHMLHQFGPCLKWPWTKLEAPELTEELVDRMVEGTAEQAAGRSIRELEKLRDGYLVAIQQVLKQFDIGAGATLKALETRLYDEAAARAAKTPVDPNQPMRLFDTTVRAEWVDYNNHMSDFRYPQIFGDAVDTLFRHVGIDSAYRAAGHSPYTVEMKVSYLAEVRQSDALYVTTQVLGADAKRFWLYPRMHRAFDHQLVATAEHIMLHVDANAKKSVPMPADVQAKLFALRDRHAALARPADAGRGLSLDKR